MGFFLKFCHGIFVCFLYPSSFLNLLFFLKKQMKIYHLKWRFSLCFTKILGFDQKITSLSGKMNINLPKKTLFSGLCIIHKLPFKSPTRWVMYLNRLSNCQNIYIKKDKLEIYLIYQRNVYNIFMHLFLPNKSNIYFVIKKKM